MMVNYLLYDGDSGGHVLLLLLTVDSDDSGHGGHSTDGRSGDCDDSAVNSDCGAGWMEVAIT